MQTGEDASRHAQKGEREKSYYEFILKKKRCCLHTEGI